MYAVGIFNDLVNVIGKGVFQLVQGVHLKSTATLRGHTVVVPPRELRNENLGIRFLGTVLTVDRKEIVDGILQHILAAVSQQHLLLGNTVYLTYFYTDNTLLALIVNAGIKTQCLGVKILDGLHHFLAGVKIKLVSV